jgi:hypothetical protein
MYTDLSGDPISDPATSCTILDSNCLASCICDTGRYGTACELDETSKDEAQQETTDLLDWLDELMTELEPTEDNLLIMVQILQSITEDVGHYDLALVKNAASVLLDLVQAAYNNGTLSVSAADTILVTVSNLFKALIQNNADTMAEQQVLSDAVAAASSVEPGMGRKLPDEDAIILLQAAWIACDIYVSEMVEGQSAIGRVKKYLQLTTQVVAYDAVCDCSGDTCVNQQDPSEMEHVQTLDQAQKGLGFFGVSFACDPDASAQNPDYGICSITTPHFDSDENPSVVKTVSNDYTPRVFSSGVLSAAGQDPPLTDSITLAFESATIWDEKLDQTEKVTCDAKGQPYYLEFDECGVVQGECLEADGIEYHVTCKPAGTFPLCASWDWENNVWDTDVCTTQSFSRTEVNCECPSTLDSQVSTLDSPTQGFYAAMSQTRTAQVEYNLPDADLETPAPTIRPTWATPEIDSGFVNGPHMFLFFLSSLLACIVAIV